MLIALGAAPRLAAGGRTAAGVSAPAAQGARAHERNGWKSFVSKAKRRLTRSLDRLLRYRADRARRARFQRPSRITIPASTFRDARSQRSTLRDADVDGSHWVFNRGATDTARRATAESTIREAYGIARKGGDRVEAYTDRSGKTFYTVQLDHAVGFEGGRAGAERGNPVVFRLRLQVDEAGQLISARPAGVHSSAPERFSEPIRLFRPPRVRRAPRRLPRGLPRDAYVATRLGVPSDPRQDASRPDDYLLVNKAGAVIAYSGRLMGPRWVAWRTTRADLGDAERTDDFRPDENLPASIPHATLEDYAGSGIDRGHLMPAASRGRDQDAMSATFELSNMLPEAGNANRGAGLHLEIYVQDVLVRQQGMEVYEYSGGIYDHGNGTSGRLSRAIGSGVPVPVAKWKIVVATRPGEPLSRSTRVIATIIPNDNARALQTDSFAGYRTTVAEIERLTGLRFFSNVDSTTARAWRVRKDTQAIPAPFAPKFMSPQEWEELRRADTRVRERRDRERRRSFAPPRRAGRRVFNAGSTAAAPGASRATPARLPGLLALP